MSDMRGFTDGATTTEANEEQARLEARNTIAFGMDMENFLGSSVGRYLAARAKVEIAEFRAQMDDIDVTDGKAIRDIQQEIAVRKIWQDWISLAIQEGLSAQETALERNVL